MGKKINVTDCLGRINLFFWCVFSIQVSWVDAGTAPVPQTGQTTSHASGDDGDLKKGIVFPAIRFVDLGDGTITDQLTGLTWMKNANCWGSQNWANALAKVAGLNTGIESCSGYTTGTHTDWRLPNRKELRSLIDYGRTEPALPVSHPFLGVNSYTFWSSTTSAVNTDSAWYVNLPYGHLHYGNKSYSSDMRAWPVRGGQ
ncbi:MAG: DUF1566 domain-containing protein [Magnetococcales bacterium]|nr:DUF1566 domain-containing protein [Magnetococcales bacterium]